ncbi:MAG: hypothetical protein JJT96_15990 [Opitutales bacterium]|nr:hypothetical protein [Opitutales bacterium]
MKTNPYPTLSGTLRRWLSPAGLSLLCAPFIPAQITDVEDEDVYELNPFVVSSAGTRSYVIDQTLAGTRLRTDLRDLASSISTVSAAFVSDIGATGSEGLLVYTANTEVGGFGGNFSGLGNVGNVEEELIAPHTNTRIRGLARADNTRDFFRTDIPWDAYNVDAVSIQRGPNSILFGVASPAGVIDTSLSKAMFENAYKLENLVDQFGRLRFTLDLNQLLIEDTLAARFIALDDQEKFRQGQAYRDTRRYYGTVTATPRLFGEDHAPMFIRLSGETGRIRANAPRFTPPRDHISPFFDPNRLNRQTVHPQAAWVYNLIGDRGTRGTGPQVQPWYGTEMSGVGGAGLPVALFDNIAGREIGINQQVPMRAMAVDGSDIDGFYETIRLISVAGFGEYARNQNALVPGSFPGPEVAWKDTVVSDPRIFDFYNNLIDGDNKREWTDFDAFNASVAQTFLSNRLGFELVYDYQKLTRGGENFFGNTLGVDVNTHLFMGEGANGMLSSWDRTGLEPGEMPDLSTVSGGVPNPNVGRAYVSGTATANETERRRENYRATGFADIDLREHFDDDSLLVRILGRHTFTGLLQSDVLEESTRAWSPFAMGLDWAQTVDPSALAVRASTRRLPFIAYLSDDLRAADLGQGLSITPINGRISPAGSRSVSFFDSTWTGTVDPADPWVRPVDGVEVTQADNPANYVGWTTRTFQVLNAEQGDIRSLYHAGGKNRREITSTGLTWQARMFDGMVIPTVGWREDRVKAIGQNAPLVDDRTRVVDPFFSLVERLDNTTITKGQTTSWGVVFRSPEDWNQRLAWLDDFTLFLNRSENFTPEVRRGFDASTLPNPSGRSRDYGFTVSTLDRRLNIKATWYRTEEKNASVGFGDAELFSNQWFLHSNYFWTIGHALNMEAWHRGENIGGQEWLYNYAEPDDGWDMTRFNELGFDHPSIAPQRQMWEAVYANVLPQEWFDAYGFPVDVAALQSPDWNVRRQAIGRLDPNHAIGGGTPIYAFHPPGDGRIGGQWPTATADNVSTGFELEINARLTDNWNLYLNASKVNARRGSLGPEFVEFIEFLHDYYAGPAGDIRQWWNGDDPTRQFFDDFIWKPFQFYVGGEGLPAPEIRPWRFNMVNSYEFREGRLEGLRVGLGLRWEDRLILGNRLNDEQDNLDPLRPIRGSTETNVDMWVGYSRPLGKHAIWDIQLNVRDVGQSKGLIPVSVNADGSVAAQRIREGMRWELRNSISF